MQSLSERLADRDTLIYAALAAGLGVILGILTVYVSPVAAIGGMIGLVVLLVFLQRPMWMGYVVIFAIVATSSMQRGRLIPLLTPNEGVLLLGISVAVVAALAYQRRVVVPLLPVLATVILLAGAVITPLFSYQLRRYNFSTSELFKLIAPAQYLLLCSVFILIPNNEQERYRLLHVMLLAASLVAFVGNLQAAGLDAVDTFLQTWYPTPLTEEAANVQRVTSLLGAWNTLGTFLMLVLLLIAALQRYIPPKPRRWFIWNARIAVVLAVPCLIATGSWASLVGLGLGFVIVVRFVGLDWRRLVPFLALIPVGILIMMPLVLNRIELQMGDSLSSSVLPQTLDYRMTVWETIYLPLIATSPIWGVSPSMENLSFAHAESQYLFLLYQGGLVALMAHLLWVGIMLYWLYRVMQKRGGLTRHLAAMVFALFVVLSIMGYTNPVFTYSGVVDYLWIMIGLIINSYHDAPVESG